MWAHVLVFATRSQNQTCRPGGSLEGTEDAVVALQANFAEFKTDFKAQNELLAESLATLQKESRARDGRIDRALDSRDRIDKTLTKARPANHERIPKVGLERTLPLRGPDFESGTSAMYVVLETRCSDT